jgi:hypothetical protein
MSFYTLERSWHVVLQAEPDEKRRLLADPGWRAIARDEWDAAPFTMVEHRRPANIRLTSVTSPELERCQCKRMPANASKEHPNCRHAREGGY